MRAWCAESAHQSSFCFFMSFPQISHNPSSVWKSLAGSLSSKKYQNIGLHLCFKIACSAALKTGQKIRVVAIEYDGTSKARGIRQRTDRTKKRLYGELMQLQMSPPSSPPHLPVLLDRSSSHHLFIYDVMVSENSGHQTLAEKLTRIWKREGGIGRGRGSWEFSNHLEGAEDDSSSKSREVREIWLYLSLQSFWISKLQSATLTVSLC